MALFLSLCSPVLLLSLCVVLSLPPFCLPESQREDSSLQPFVTPELPSELNSNLTDFDERSNGKCSGLVECAPGIILPVWKPVNPGLGEQIARAVIYFVFLMYMFLGVSIVADRFMASIEVITSQVR